LNLRASFIPPLLVIKGSSSPVNINLTLLNSLKLTIFALRASVNSEQFPRVCSKLSHHIHLYCQGRSEFEVGAGPGARGFCLGCPSKNSVSFEICLVSSSMESDAAG